MSVNLDKKLKNSVQTGLIQKTFVEHRDRLLEYARTYYSSQINDFSETSLGGMLLDFAALVGDSMTYYVQQQVNELDYETATNIQNINRHLRKAGIKAAPPSPSVANVRFTIIVQATNNFEINQQLLPVIKKGTTLNSTSQIPFVLAEDVDFTDTNTINSEVLTTNDSGQATSFIISKSGLCISGERTEEVTFIEGDPTDFLSYTLENQNVTFIEKIIDSDLNEYYEVEYLSQDTIYKKVNNDNDTYFEVVPCAYRFVREENFNSNITTLRFGNGNGKTLKDDILVNPEDLSLPLLGRNYSTRFSLDPQKLLSSMSLGISPANKTLKIVYMHGGGLSHNVPSSTITEVENSIFSFPNMTAESELNNQLQIEVVRSLNAINLERAVGGSNGFSMDELLTQIPNALKMQSRIITHKDLLARLYTMPANYGRVHKAAVIKNPYTSLTKDLCLVCKDDQGFYVKAQDVLKVNIQKYINEFRLIGDTFNIVDSDIINFSINLNVKINSGFDVADVIDEVKTMLIANLRFDALQIGEPININSIIQVALGIPGVLSVVTPIKNIITINTKEDQKRISSDILLEYNNTKIDVQQKLDNGLLFPTSSGIFELKYPEYNVRVRGT